MLGKRYSGLLDYTEGLVHHGLITRAIFHLTSVDATEELILQWMRENPGLHTLDEIAAAANLESKQAFCTLHHLKRAEFITREVSPDTGERLFRLSKYATQKLTKSDVTNQEVLSDYLSGAWQYGRLRIFDFLVMLAMQIFIARWTGVAGFGHVVVITLLAALIGQMSTFGLPSALGVFLPTYRDDVDRSLFKGAYRYVLMIVIPSSILITLLSIGVILLLPMSAEMSKAYIWGFSIIPIWVLWDIAQQPCIALKKWNRAWGPDFFVAPVVWVAALMILHYVYKADSPVGIMVCKVIAGLVPTVLQVILAEGLIRSQTGDVRAEYEIGAWWKKSGLLLGINMTNMVRSSIVVLVANFILGARVAGQFAAVKSTLAPTKIIRAIFKSSATPEIPAFYKSGRKMHLHFLAHSMTAGVTIGTLLLLPLAIMYGREFLSLYGMHSESAYVVLLIMMSARILTALFGYPNAILSLTQFQRVSMWISILTLFSLLGLVIILVLPVSEDTQRGMYMLAIVYLINQLLFGFLCWWALLRKLVLSTLASVLILPPKARIMERMFRRKDSLVSDEIAEARSLGQVVPLVGLIGRHDPISQAMGDDN